MGVCHTDAIEDVRTEEAAAGALAILGQVGEGHAAVGKHGMDLVGEDLTTTLTKAEPSILPTLSWNST